MFIMVSLKIAMGTEANIEVSPVQPVVGENFNLKFRVNLTNANDEPNISFDPGTAEVLGKESTGLSIQTVVINGKFTTIKEMVVVYEMISSRPGKVKISDIKVEGKNGSIKIPDVIINIVEQEKVDRQGDVFVLAISSKKRVYIGEGFNVDYYLYFRVPAGAKEISEFPKLNNFTKRFQTPTEGNERVEYNGDSYVRQKIYGARLYAMQEGKQYIDPIKLKVQYSSAGQDNSTNGFGFAFRQYRTGVFSSKKLEISVLPVPLDNRPKNFTGLVGKHEVKFSLGETKFLVNQPIEYSLEISGSGMLESYEPPKIFSHDNLESFDTKSDFEEQGSNLSRKKFEYTTLPRGPLTLADHELEISYFLPDENRFEVKKIKIPTIRVEGEMAMPHAASSTAAPSADDIKVNDKLNGTPSAKEIKSIELLPIYLNEETFHLFNIKTVQKILFLLNLVLVLSLVPYKKYFFSDIDIEARSILSSIYKKNINYQKMFVLINYIAEKRGYIKLNGFEIPDILRSLKLSDAATGYFINLFETLEKMSYEGKVISKNIGIEKKFFKELEFFLRNK